MRNQLGIEVFKNIIGTIGARYLVAILNLLLIFINAKVLGREGIGLVGMIYALANLAVMFNSILCGNTIVYFMNRYGLRYVFVPAYAWAIAGSAIACAAMSLFKAMPEGYETAVFALAALISLVNSNTLMLLGEDRVKAFNFVYIINGGLLFVALLCIYFLVEEKSVAGYLAGLLGAFFAAFAFSLALLAPALRKWNNPADGNAPLSWLRALKEMVVFGLWGCIDNLAEGLATRLNYFIVQNFGGYGKVGLLDAGTKISESVWHISRSVGFLEYSSVSKTTDAQEHKRITLQLFKLTYCALIAVMAVVACIPEWVYTDFLLTAEFAGVRKVVLAMSPGIVAFGANQVLSHYFIGSGNIRYSAFCSIFGLGVLIAAGYALIAPYGVTGAAAASSTAYLCMSAFSLFVFKRKTKAAFMELLPSKADWLALRSRLGGLFRREKSH